MAGLSTDAANVGPSVVFTIFKTEDIRGKKEGKTLNQTHSVDPTKVRGTKMWWSKSGASGCEMDDFRRSYIKQEMVLYVFKEQLFYQTSQNHCVCVHIIYIYITSKQKEYFIFWKISLNSCSDGGIDFFVNKSPAKWECNHKYDCSSRTEHKPKNGHKAITVCYICKYD